MKKSIFSQIVILFVSLGVLIVVLFNSDPTSATQVVFLAFYLCLWIVLWSLSCLLSTVIIVLFRRQTTLSIVMRRAVEFATVTVSVILFSSLGVLNALTLIALIFSAILLELFFISRKKEVSI